MESSFIVGRRGNSVKKIIIITKNKKGEGMGANNVGREKRNWRILN